MARPVTLFTGQWADLSFETLCKKAKQFGYDGLELACWGDHFEVEKVLDGKAGASYVKKRWATLQKHGLKCFAVSSHLVGQCVCDNIDARHQQIAPKHVYGDGKPEGVRQRAAEEMKRTAKAVLKVPFDAAPKNVKSELQRVVREWVYRDRRSGIWFTRFRRCCRGSRMRDSPISQHAGIPSLMRSTNMT